ncbi:MAG: TIM barrel protein [Peptostreptococcaceae bacterium]|nr:TIM barrel protein [Peptostreptococcaceae bacterium]
MKNNFGTNAVFIGIGEAMDLNLNRVEFCLGGMDAWESKAEKILLDMKTAEKNSVAYSIHLPIFLPEWFSSYFLDAFYLDPDPAKRELSFKLLEYNLERLTPSPAEYFVIHFPGKYDADEYEDGAFRPILEDSMSRLDSIAKKFDTTLLLEYFGSNELFYRIDDWQREIGKHFNIGILLDTGHLFFASVIRKFDFMENLKLLSKTADAFHLWTTKGQEAYCSNDYYIKYRHIPMCQGQTRRDGWAFDTDTAMRIISGKKRPALMEASYEYGGKEYIKKGIESLKKYYL